MRDGYGKIFLLLLAIGLIFLASSGKALEIYNLLTNKSISAMTTYTTSATPTATNTVPRTSDQLLDDYTKGSSGSGGVLS